MASDGQSSKHQELLPGIADNVTLTNIVTKLPWGTLRALCSVSRNWRQVIQAREVYKARVSSHSRETLVVVKHLDPSSLEYAISLYSMRENTFYRLPPMSSSDGGICCLFRYVSWCSGSGSVFSSLDGKLYVESSNDESELGICECDAALRQDPNRVCVLDVAGQKQWKHCASAEIPGREYAVKIGSGILAGRISFLQGGDEDWFDSAWRKYDSSRGEWRKVEMSLMQVLFSRALGAEEGIQFLVQGKTYWICKSSLIYNHIISVYNSDSRSWADQHSVSCNGLGAELAAELNCNDYINFDLLFILPVNGELVAKAQWKTHDREGICLLQSRGFGTEHKSIVWQKIPLPFQIHDICAIFPIQL